MTAERANGLAAALGDDPYPLKVVNGDWTERGGARAVSSWLRLKTVDLFQPDVVACQNDVMALGARQILRERRPEWSHVPLLGCDGLPAGGQQAVASGLLAATVVIPFTPGPEEIRVVEG